MNFNNSIKEWIPFPFSNVKIKNIDTRKGIFQI
jgi:hypothetical protein